MFRKLETQTGSGLPSLLRLVHTCNVTTYRNAVRLQVTDTIRSYELNFHPVPHGVRVSCERYTLGFPICYGSPSDVFAFSSGFVHLYTLHFKEERAVVSVTLPVHICSGRNRIIPLMGRPNIDSTPNKPVTLPRNQLLIRYVATSPVHTVTIRCYGTR